MRGPNFVPALRIIDRQIQIENSATVFGTALQPVSVAVSAEKNTHNQVNSDASLNAKDPNRTTHAFFNPGASFLSFRTWLSLLKLQKISETTPQSPGCLNGRFDSNAELNQAWNHNQTATSLHQPERGISRHKRDFTSNPDPHVSPAVLSNGFRESTTSGTNENGALSHAQCPERKSIYLPTQSTNITEPLLGPGSFIVGMCSRFDSRRRCRLSGWCTSGDLCRGFGRCFGRS